MVDAARARKIADRIQRIVAEMLDRRIKDPRLGFVTVTDARITADLRDATVYYTVFGTPEEKAASAAALESAKGVIRSEVGRQTGIRHTPSLAFVIDEVQELASQVFVTTHSPYVLERLPLDCFQRLCRDDAATVTATATTILKAREVCVGPGESTARIYSTSRAHGSGSNIGAARRSGTVTTGSIGRCHSNGAMSSFDVLRSRRRDPLLS